MMSRVAIIGGGFSGAMTAVNLARLSREPLHITIVNGQRPLGRGIAYATRRKEHLLNVAARNMSAFPDLPDHFVQWLGTRSDFDLIPLRDLREQFIPRLIFGDYLRSIVQHHLLAGGGMTAVKAEFIEGEAIDIEPSGEIHLASGERLTADRIVLACGNEMPAELPGAEALGEHPAWIGNPWLPWEKNLPPDGGSVVLLGTGLTSVDAILTMRALGWHGTIHAVSRHGWFPHAHFRGIDYPDFPPADVDVATLGLDRLLALVGDHCAILHERDANPAIIVDKLRPHTQRIWSHFGKADRLAFAQKHAARWNVHRHRIAPDIHAQITSSQLTGQLQVHAASISKLQAAQGKIVIHLENGTALDGDLVLNATGPATKFSATRSVLLQNLLRRGVVSPDETDMGVRVDPDHTVSTGDGDRSPWLLALGPILRGTYWETIAVPELRVQARRVAETLLGSTRMDVDEGQLLLEYMI